MFVATCTPSQQNQSKALRGEKVRFFKPIGEPTLTDHIQVEDSLDDPYDIFVPTQETMQHEKYQDLTGLGWFESSSRPWAVGEDVVNNRNEMQGSRWLEYDDEDNNLFNGDNAQYYSIRKTDSYDEIKNLSSTQPTEVVPMRYHEELQVKAFVKDEGENIQKAPQETLKSPNLTPVTADCDLLEEMNGKDLIDFLMSDEIPSTTSRESFSLPSSSEVSKTRLHSIKNEEMKETYLAIPRQITSNSEDRRLPKMVILKTPRSAQNELSTINFGDVSKSIAESIADRIKISGKRPRSKRYSTVLSDNESDDDDDDDDHDDNDSIKGGRKPNKRTRRSSTTSSSTSSADRYRELRDKNNEASRRSRLNRKEKERDLMNSLDDAERDNLRLKTRSSELEKLVNSLRQLLLQVVLRAGSHNR